MKKRVLKIIISLSLSAILAGLIVMFLTIFLLPSIANFIFREMKTMVVMVIEGMY